MNPSNAISSATSRLQDPIKLPREIFLLFFTFVDHRYALRRHKYILDWSTISRKWRDTILSSPTLFEDLELYCKDENPATDSLARHGKANRMINKLIGYANLSNNRLKSVGLYITTFPAEMGYAYKDWYSTKFSVLFNVLSWSSSTLTTLRLTFYPVNCALSTSILHVAAVIKHLDCLDCLREVVICSEVGLDLKSSSPCRRIRVYDEYGTIDWDNREVNGEYGSTLAILFHQMTEFTGEGMKSVSIRSLYPMSLDALKELDRLRESLSDLRLDFRPTDDDVKSQLILSFPNLTKLNLTIWDPEENRGEIQFSLEVPSNRGYPIKLKDLHLEVDVEEGCQLVLGEQFCKSLYFLERFYIHQDGPSSLLPITNSQRLQQLLSSSISSLQSLQIYRMKLDAGLGEAIHLHQLVELHIAGNSDLIEFFLDISYNSLKELSLTLWKADEGVREKFNHWKLIGILKSCQSSLQILDVTDRNEIDDTLERVASGSVAKSKLSEDHQSSFEMPKICSLTLELEDDVIMKHYLPIQYPILPSVELRYSSRFFQSDFSLKPQDSLSDEDQEWIPQVRVNKTMEPDWNLGF